MAIKDELLNLVPRRNELSPVQRFRLESSISDKFGKEGLRIYFLVDGTNSVQKIMEQTGVDDRKMISVLEFLSKNGITDIRDSLLAEAIGPEAAPQKLSVSSDKAGVMPSMRSASEKKVFDKFGMRGVEVYRLTDTAGTPDEILEKVEITPEDLLEMLDYLRNEGLIGIEKAEKKVAPEPEVEEPEPEPAPEPKPIAAPAPKPVAVPAPVVSKPGEAKKAALVAVEEAAPHPVSLPVKRSLGLFGKLKIEAGLLKRFGQKGIHVYGLIDGEKTTVKLAKETRYGFAFVDSIMDFLSSEGAVEVRPLGNDGIKERYGEEGVAINDVYGRDGLLVYELIDKKATIKEIIMASGVEPKKGVEIFGFIHKILGVDIPFDSHALLRQMGVEE